VGKIAVTEQEASVLEFPVAITKDYHKGVGFIRATDSGDWSKASLYVVSVVVSAASMSSCIELAGEIKPLSQLTSKEMLVLQTAIS
jgi:hypothetical protein